MNTSEYKTRTDPLFFFCNKVVNRKIFKGLQRFIIVAAIIFLPNALHVNQAHAAGTLTPTGAAHQPIQIRDHHVDVVINNGFAKTEATQTFYNPNDVDLEAVYSMPVPKNGSLSEFTIYVGETEINGEVVPRKKANDIYEEEKKQGNDAGVANKNSYQNYEFKVARVKAKDETRIRFVYYQPISVDTGVGKYVYPLEEGGTDDAGASFWTLNEKVENSFSAQIDVRMAYPIADVRMPGYEAAAKIEKLADGHRRATLAMPDGSLSRDLILYYRLEENLPARVELLPYRAEKDKPGSFMLVVTPGVDLQPLSGGADYTFVLDLSGSMSGKLHTLVNGVQCSIGELKDRDRYRIITFSDSARDLTRGWVPASKQNVTRTLADLDGLRPGGSTNLYDGLSLALKNLDDDRVTSIVLVTDGVTNTGVIQPKRFAALMAQYDVRVFGFLLGNSSNWPLMRVVCETSGGFYSAVSNSDDILGQILLAKNKIRFEALHNAELSIRGVKTFESTEEAIGKIYRGEQLVVLGRYKKPGTARIRLKASLSGADKVYETDVVFPEIDTTYPEIERIWAMERVEQIEYRQNLGVLDASEGASAIESLGVEYQIVTDETSMLVLSEEAFKRHKISRRNKVRVARERKAQVQRYRQPVRSNRVDKAKPMFSGKSHGLSGGGAMDPLSAAWGVGLFGLALLGRRRRDNGEQRA